MTAARWTLWILLAAVFTIVLAVVQYPVRKRRLLPLRAVLVLGKLLLGTFIAFLIVAMVNPVSYKCGFVLAAVYAALFGDVLGDLFSLPVLIKRKHENCAKMQTVICLITTMLFLAFGSVNMQVVTPDHHEYPSDKISRDYRFVFVSDLHAGSSQSMKTTADTIMKISNEEPDFVILGGDIVDELTTKEEMEETFALFGRLQVPVYFVYGNHDVQPDAGYFGGAAFTQADIEAALRLNGIIILRDEWVRYSEDLVISGRDDHDSSSRKDISELEPYPDGSFVILADHTPYNTEEITESSADLQLSGHSHAGQLFPLRWIYQIAGYDAYGPYHYGNTDLYVSSGASGWCFPFRTEAFCHYEVVTLKSR